MRRLSVRLLHIRPDHVSGRAFERTMWCERRGGEGIHERQYLPLRRISKHRGRDSKGARGRQDGMKTFQITRPGDYGQAISATAKAKTAQQGADIRFIAGGTTLIDLMKLNVEQPQNLVDVNPLLLDKI